MVEQRSEFWIAVTNKYQKISFAMMSTADIELSLSIISYIKTTTTGILRTLQSDVRYEKVTYKSIHEVDY